MVPILLKIKCLNYLRSLVFTPVQRKRCQTADPHLIVRKSKACPQRLTLESRLQDPHDCGRRCEDSICRHGDRHGSTHLRGPHECGLYDKRTLVLFISVRRGKIAKGEDRLSARLRCSQESCSAVASSSVWNFHRRVLHTQAVRHS